LTLVFPLPLVDICVRDFLLPIESTHSIKEELDMARLIINGKTQQIDVDPNTPLLWVIREQAGLTGTKYGCGVAQCGACTVHVDGAAVRSCVMPVSAAEGKQITTIEGLAVNGVLSKVQRAWLEHDVPQCGYCQAGMIMARISLPERTIEFSISQPSITQFSPMAV
jgi:isoquinoline 1-oxidoreductase alpha subunit